ncbi:MAG: dihydroorotate dehydrogenase 1B [Methanomethylovorans sp. PtaU1.Bin093]|uniref:methanogenesis marker 9 domain-containing protein n=1 Tax=Methanomethylovorans sp. PtaU1.Bin093 TaxID=1811679 RepID=UPI0009C6A916|nr:methanogenesis marker 9 domain-containing protein [Methanomethylovorans sp. PtaU1.Bin093]OPY19480.1 MAG: dihydroorotate dehydrogenase 1B [Methanomethylovorans sp. PtaU1.Bin093]
MSEDLFDIKIDDLSFKNPIALAPMGGITDSRFANEFAKDAGLVILGGYNLDAATNLAASEMAKRGRKEFFSDEPLKLIENELGSVKTESVVAINLRSSTLEPLIEAARMAKNANAIIEIDAHCRQPEMIRIGVGEALLRDLSKLQDTIRKVKATGVIVSVKVRANVIDNIKMAKAIEDAGADILHVDAMKKGSGADMETIRKIRDATRLLLIGNNSVTDFDTAKEMFTRGADMVSVGRGVMEDPSLISSLVKEVTLLQQEIGWYNSPKHVCRGEGDLRGLAFCCLPVKPCPVHSNIKKIGLSAKEFADIKMEFAKGTPLEYGDSTCFGSLVWCCKITKMCPLRDGVLETIGLSDAEYMKLKRQLADHILDHPKVTGK